MASHRQTTSASQPPIGAEQQRLEEDAQRQRHWNRWGPYLSERAWGTVREDYSPHGTVWEAFPHDHARSRAYRWNEDGLAGICDRHQLICFAVALWNGRDPILKERVFGLPATKAITARTQGATSSRFDADAFLRNTSTSTHKHRSPIASWLKRIAVEGATILSLN
jgi:hypothetical protein